MSSPDDHPTDRPPPSSSPTAPPPSPAAHAAADISQLDGGALHSLQQGLLEVEEASDGAVRHLGAALYNLPSSPLLRTTRARFRSALAEVKTGLALVRALRGLVDHEVLNRDLGADPREEEEDKDDAWEEAVARLEGLTAEGLELLREHARTVVESLPTTRAPEEAPPTQHTLKRRILSFLNGAPRTVDEVVAAMSGVSGPFEDDLEGDDKVRVTAVLREVDRLVVEEVLYREPCAGEPEHLDFLRPGRYAGGRS